MTGDDDDLRISVACRCLAQELDAAAVGQHEIEQDHVGMRRQQIARRLHGTCAGGREALIGDELGEDLGGDRIVVDDEGVRHAGVCPVRVSCRKERKTRTGLLRRRHVPEFYS